MASMVRMDTALGFQTADKFNQSADTVQSVVDGVNAQVQSLYATWEGSSRTRFEGEYEAWKGDMLRFIQLLRDIATRVRKETQEMVDADMA